MGATEFTTYADGTDLQAAFKAAVEEARYEYGSGGYTGSIAEKGSVVLIDRVLRSQEMGYQEAQRLITEFDPRIDDKWGPAGAFMITRKSEITRVRDYTVTMKSTDWLDVERMGAEVAKRNTGNDTVLAVKSTLGKAKFKVTSEATKGKAVTRYVTSLFPHSTWDTGFETQAKARAWVTEALKSGDVWPQATVEAVTRREDGSPLVQATRNIVTVPVTFRVTYGNLGPHDGFVFFGWASE